LVYTIADIFKDPHFQARQMLQQVPHEQLGYTTQAGVVPRLSGTPGGIYRSGPSLGQDSADVLQRELHLSPERVQALVASGAVVLPSSSV